MKEKLRTIKKDGAEVISIWENINDLKTGLNQLTDEMKNNILEIRCSKNMMNILKEHGIDKHLNFVVGE